MKKCKGPILLDSMVLENTAAKSMLRKFHIHVLIFDNQTPTTFSFRNKTGLNDQHFTPV